MNASSDFVFCCEFHVSQPPLFDQPKYQQYNFVDFHNVTKLQHIITDLLTFLDKRETV